MFRYFILMILAISLTACVSNDSPENTPPALFSKLDFNATFYLNKDKVDGSDDYLDWRFVALQALIKEARFNEANALIESLQNNLNKTEDSSPQLLAQKEALALLIADKYYAQSNLKDAKAKLEKIDQKQLSNIALNYYLKLYTGLLVAYKEHQGAVDTLFVLLPRLTDEQDVQKYNDLLLEQLAKLPLETLQTPQTTAYKSGWYALASEYKQYQARPNKLKRSVKLWLTTYAEHELQKHMPNQVINLPEFSPYNPENIAVLLPLSGRVKGAGEAVQYGITEAFYHQQKNKNNGEITPKLHFINTSTTSNEDILAELKSLNIDFIIGPLVKHKIAGLLTEVESTPTIILNAFPEKEGKSQAKITKKTVTPTINNESNEGKDQVDVNDSIHFSITLSPEEEAQQAAILMQLKGHKNPLVIAPKNDYGKRVAKAFNEQWELNHEDNDASSHASIYYFKNTAQFAHFIDGVLLTGKSKQRIHQMKAITGRKLETEVRSRRDVDAIYIVSKRNELILLKPFINTTVSTFASKIPLYANSRSHNADKMNTQNKELSELVFSDNSFLLDDDLKVSPATKRLLKHDRYSALRLMALGYDSYELIYQVMSLKYIKDYSYKGQLGNLTLDEHNNIQTKLGWATYTKEGDLIEAIAPTAGK